MRVKEIELNTEKRGKSMKDILEGETSNSSDIGIDRNGKESSE